MRTASRLSLYLAGLVVIFVAMFVAARAFVPETTVTAWTEEATESAHHPETEEAGTPGAHGDHADHGAEGEPLSGLSVEHDGYRMSPVKAPGRVGERGRLSFRIEDAEGRPLADYRTSHEKDLHLIVVRTDGAGFRHVHPTLNRKTGTWSVPWTWAQGGTYRVFADFVPGGPDATRGVTLSRSVDAAGSFTPVVSETSRAASVGGFDLTLRGDLEAGSERELTIRVTRNGEPVTDLQPYLGAFGHLVALREGDLAYIHVHPEGEHAHAGDTAGPEIGFATEVPIAGRYLMYLDFKVDGQVHTAEFVMEAR